MKAVVLGSAAGGGFPQWNSGSAGCRRARSGDPLAKLRTQTSIAISSGDGSRNWFVINAAPDLRQQIEATRCLQPDAAIRSSPIKGVVLTSGEVDAIAGLLTLRERQSLSVFATADTLAILAANPIFDVLSPDSVQRAPVALEHPFALTLPDGQASGLTCTLFAVPGKVPLYLEQGQAPEMVTDGTTVGARLSDDASEMFFIPGCAAMTPDLAERLRDAACVLFDGTLWRDDEMLLAGAGPKTGRRMGHMSVSGPDGVLAAFADLGVRRRVLIHINNTNPILLEDSAEHAAVRAAGWDVAWDGMELFA